MTKVFEWLKQHRLIFILLIIGAAVRTLYAGSIPGGLNQDEASIGYDAYSILHYGMDRNGISLPVHHIAWGSGQNALYAYLSMPFIYLFGLNVWSVRAVSISIGLVSMILFYLIAGQLFKRNNMAAAAAFLIVICPWHIMASRWALESNLFPPLMLLAVFFLFKALHQPKWLIGFTITLAASLYAYGTAYFFVPVFGFGVLILLGVQKTFTPLRLLWNGALMLILSLPIILFVLINRFDGSTIHTPFFSIPKLTVPRVEQVSTAFEGDAISMLVQHFKSFLHLFITQNDGLIWNAIPPYGYMYPIAMPLIAIGFCYTGYQIVKQRSIEMTVIAGWFLTAFLMSLITDVNINRINIIFYPTLFLTLSGLLWLRDRIKYSFIVVITAFSIFFGSFCFHYFTEYPRQISPAFFESFGEAVQYASSKTEGSIYVTNKVMMPYIYVLFYEKTDPRLFQSTVRYMNPGAPFQFVASFDRYVFEKPHLRVGEAAAYIFANSEEIPSVELGYTIKRFKHYTVVSGAGSAGVPAAQEGFRNGGFEVGEQSWSLSPGTGIGTNRPYSGANLLYLDPGEARIASQTFINNDEGIFSLSAMVSTNAAGGRIGVRINDVVAAEAYIEPQEAYTQLELPAVHAGEKDIITVYIIGGANWINVDDMEWKAKK
ncbi:4-amino-4-deoxy-L-arabinose transferase-like glycosyltransferase [Paenibacillus castaneae]|uniref:ArnT family glycosyltransferase n=1 Tax=Paenibacillus castaneae TaxID=474957 RepID=UPI000C9BD57E|nr:glycosyltransferase family 39 protein [Paenibacillus castaneae]NIK76262.1 4-amino-4-deoxy-L-arabinose transferase-like glycosyltransferase [Paenibacillus castaneae]